VMLERDPGTLDGRELRARMLGPTPANSLAELDHAYEDARRAYLAGDFGASLATLRAILVDLEKHPDGAERFRQWTRTMMRLARLELELGDGKAGRAAIEQLLRAAPAIEIDRRLFPPRFIREVESVRASLAASPTHALRVKASVDGARVFVDGRDAGAAPLNVVLPEGAYRVSAARGDLRAQPVVADLTSGDREVVLDFTIP
jgi:PEGA domain-containing protein